MYFVILELVYVIIILIYLELRIISEWSYFNMGYVIYYYVKIVLVCDFVFDIYVYEEMCVLVLIIEVFICKEWYFVYSEVVRCEYFLVFCG